MAAFDFVHPYNADLDGVAALLTDVGFYGLQQLGVGCCSLWRLARHYHDLWQCFIATTHPVA